MPETVTIDGALPVKIQNHVSVQTEWVYAIDKVSEVKRVIISRPDKDFDEAWRDYIMSKLASGLELHQWVTVPSFKEPAVPATYEYIVWRRPKN